MKLVVGSKCPSATCGGSPSANFASSSRTLGLFWTAATIGLAVASPLVLVEAQTKSATVVAHCQSLGLDNFAGTIPGVGGVVNFVTTFDGRTDRQPLTQVQPGGNFYVSQELRPRSGQPGVYEADYMTADSDGLFVEYGSFTLQLPSTDNDRNGVPDFAQRAYSGSVDLSGSGRSDWPYQNPFSLQGRMNRSAGSTVGSYSLTLTGAAGAIAYAGSVYLVHVSGDATYTRANESQITFDLTRTERAGRSATLRGTTTFTVQSADTLVLSQFVLTGSDGYNYTVKPCTLARSGHTFRGAAQIADGTMETSWPDYVDWVIEINDPSDSDGDGVPDLSDTSGQPPIITLQPTNQVAYAGSSVQLVTQVTGSSPLEYQWFFDGAAITGPTSRTLKIDAAEPHDAGAYTLRIANGFGSVVSVTAFLIVVPFFPPTPVGGEIAGAVTWANTNSAYRLDADMLIPYGAELTLAPGTALLGQGKAIWVEGDLTGCGTKSSPIQFENVHVRPGRPDGETKPGEDYRIYLAFCSFNQGSIHGATGHGVHGNIVLTDSIVADVPYMHIYYPVADSYIERNVFREFGGISSGHREANVLIRNNVFHEPVLTSGRRFAVENWAAYQSSQTVVQLNSFMFTNGVAVSLPQRYWDAKLIAVSNFWSSTDPKVIESMINDRNDGTNFASVISYLPFLADHDPATPLPPPTITSGPESQAVAVGDAVEFNVVATGEPLRYQWRHDESDIPGGTNCILSIPLASPKHGGRYDVLVRTASGEVRSAEASLYVSPPDGSPLIVVNGTADAAFSFTNVEECVVRVLTSLRNPSVFYTLDGSVPDFNGQPYSGPLPLRRSAVVRAAVYDSEFRRRESEPVQVDLHLSPPAVLVGNRAATRFDHTNVTAVLVVLGQTMAGASIYYTLDGSVPSTNSSVYSAPFVLTESANIWAMAYTSDLGVAVAEPVAINLWKLHALTATSAGGGMMLIDPPDGVYRNDKVVGLEAEATPGWTFLRWEGDWESTSPAIHVPMNIPRTIRAIFGTPVGTTATGRGTVLLHPSLSACPFGSTVQCVAVPERGYSFGVWGGSASGNVNPLLFAVTNPSPVIAALFSLLPSGRHALTVIPNGRGTVTVNPRANSFADGDTVFLQATPDGEARFLGWAGDAAGEANPLSITMHSSRVITANFTGGEYTLQLSGVERLPDGSVTLTIVGEPGKTVVLEASNDLRTWAALRVLANPSGVTSAFDQTATNRTTRFYRASSP